MIVAAGPLFNFLLAVVIFFGFFLIIGIDDITPLVRQIDRQGPAYEAGMRIGDRIVSIGDRPIEAWVDVLEALDRSGGRKLQLAVRRGEQTFHWR